MTMTREDELALKLWDEEHRSTDHKHLAIRISRRLRAAWLAELKLAWRPIETAPKDNKKPLLLASFNEDGSLQSIDYDGTWQSDRESWEMPQVYWYWATAEGRVEEPSHWMYQPDWYAVLPDVAPKDCNES